jgi:excisionase family DNA binding protein
MTDAIQSLTVRETAAKLKVTERFVAKLIAQRVLPSYQLGRRRLIRQAALQSFIERRETVVR